jgi:TatD DNase family protein
MIIDTHCHYNLEPLYGESGTVWQDHWRTAQEHDVTHSIVVGTDITTSLRAIEICRDTPNLRAAVGFHPHVIGDSLEKKLPTETQKIEDQIHEWIIHLQKVLQNAPTKKIVAIGETGLDYFRIDLATQEAQHERALQQQLFIEQIKLADSQLLPLILHVRDTGETAYADTLHLLKENKKSNIPFILHCVSGSVSYVQDALEMGAYVGVAGNVSYKNATKIHEIVKSVPKDRLLLETDAPFLPPVPHRGKTCEPWMIQLTGQVLQEQFGITLEQLYTNTLQVFPSLRTT